MSGPETARPSLAGALAAFDVATLVLARREQQLERCAIALAGRVPAECLHHDGADDPDLFGMFRACRREDGRWTLSVGVARRPPPDTLPEAVAWTHLRANDALGVACDRAWRAWYAASIAYNGAHKAVRHALGDADPVALARRLLAAETRATRAREAPPPPCEASDTERLVDGKVVHAYPGATFWRFAVYDPTTDACLAITAHRYDSARDALDAGTAWVKHPYPLD